MSGQSNTVYSSNVHVSLSLNFFNPLTYRYTADPASLQPGIRVVVPLANRFTTGWITQSHSDYDGKVKPIIAVIEDSFLPDSKWLDFLTAVSQLYFVSIGTLLDATLPPSRKNISNLYFINPSTGKTGKLIKHSFTELVNLSNAHPAACFYNPVLKPSPEEQIEPHHIGEIENFPPQRFLVGCRREIPYSALIRDCIDRQQSVLLTVPDNLTARFWGDCLKSLGPIDFYTSTVKPKARDALWEEYAVKGKTGVVIGGQSAAFLPIRNLGLIISDRAGSSIYKRNLFSPYNINVLSQLRAHHLNIPLVEGFPGYSLRAYQAHSLLPSPIAVEDRRPREKSSPVVNVHRIPPGVKGIPSDFIETVGEHFTAGKKILVLLNKKESTQFLFCEKCDKIRRCPSCEGSINVDDEFRIQCTRCGFQDNYSICPVCKESLSIVEDISISSIKKILKNRVAESGIITITSEGLSEEFFLPLLNQVKESKIVISTPAVVNPYFNNIFDAVLYLRPESYFNIDEFDAAEKIFSLTAELKELVKEGGVIDIFSTFHFHYALKTIDDEASFFQRELNYREWFHLPPFCNVYHITLKDKKLRKLGSRLRAIYREYKDSFHIKRVYLVNRKAVKGIFKGMIEARTSPETILKTKLLEEKDIAVELIMV